MRTLHLLQALDAWSKAAQLACMTHSWPVGGANSCASLLRCTQSPSMLSQVQHAWSYSTDQRPKACTSQHSTAGRLQHMHLTCRCLHSSGGVGPPQDSQGSSSSSSSSSSSALLQPPCHHTYSTWHTPRRHLVLLPQPLLSNTTHSSLGCHGSTLPSADQQQQQQQQQRQQQQQAMRHSHSMALTGAGCSSWVPPCLQTHPQRLHSTSAAASAAAGSSDTRPGDAPDTPAAQHSRALDAAGDVHELQDEEADEADEAEVLLDDVERAGDAAAAAPDAEWVADGAVSTGSSSYDADEAYDSVEEYDVEFDEGFEWEDDEGLVDDLLPGDDSKGGTM